MSSIVETDGTIFVSWYKTFILLAYLFKITYTQNSVAIVNWLMMSVVILFTEFAAEVCKIG